jgi:predicted CoA-binding protein
MNDAPLTQDAPLRALLQSVHTIAVVGLSADPQRPSHGVAAYLLAHGYRVVPVNPAVAEVLGQRSYARLEDIPFAVDLVNVFRKTADVLPVAQSALAIGARGVWQQLGVANREADALVRAAGRASVLDRCIKIDHARLLG